MANLISLTAKPRVADVKPKVLRRAELVPGVIYGRGFEPRNVQFEYLPLHRAVLQAGMSHILSVSIEGDAVQHDVLIRDIQHDPITGRLSHIDLFRIEADRPIRVEVPILLRGEPDLTVPGSRLSHLLETLDVESLPRDVPDSFVVDVSKMKGIGAVITVAELQIPENVTLHTSRDTEIVRITAGHVTAEVEEAPAEAATEGESEAAPKKEAS